MFSEISALYLRYVKTLATYKVQFQLLSMKMADVSAKCRGLSISDIFKNYEMFDSLIQQAFALFSHQSFLRNSRLGHHIVLRLMVDLVQIYKVFYVLISEILERFSSFSME